MIKYIFRDTVTFRGARDVDPQVIGEALQKIKDDNGGDLQPQYVWRAAKIARHPLHKHFQWDIQLAAEAHWTDTSRQLIGSVRIARDDDRSEPMPAFISINDGKNGTSYRTVAEVMDNTELQIIALRQAERELEALLQDVRGYLQCDPAREIADRKASRETQI